MQATAEAEAENAGGTSAREDGSPDQTERWRQRLRLQGDRVRRSVGLGPAEARRAQETAKARFFLTPEGAGKAAAAVKARLPEAVGRAVEAADRAAEPGSPTRAEGAPAGMGDLARAWFYTKEYGYLWRLSDLWRSAHRPGRGENWAEAAPAAELRLAVWLARLLEQSDARIGKMFEADAGRLARSVYARTLVDPPADVIEALSCGQALSLAGAALPVFEESGKWRALGRRNVSDLLRDRMLEDGALEGCPLPAHHRALAILLEHFELEPEAERTALRGDVERIAEFLARLLQTGWPHPYFLGASIEDEIGAGFLGYEPGGPDLLGAAAVVLGRGDWKAWASGPSEAAFWMLGEDAGKRFDELEAKPRPRGGYRQISGRHVSAHPAGGGCLLAGVESSGEPGALGFVWQRGPRDWVIERGFEQPGDTLFWSQGETLTALTGRNGAVERTIAHFAAGRVFVLDRYPRQQDAARQHWRVAGDLARVGFQADSISFESAEGPTLALLAASDARWSSEVSETFEGPAADGGRVLETTCRAEAGAAERAVLLLPGEAARSTGTLGRVAPQAADGASVYVWRRNSSVEVFLVGGGAEWRALGWSGKARFVWWRADAGGRVEELIAAPGEELQAGKVRLPAAAGRIRWVRGQRDDVPPLELGYGRY